MSGLVIAAIGLQLLLCSAATAAHACTGTIDRIESSVVHALREIVDRQIAQDQSVQLFEPGYRLADCSLTASNTASILTCSPTASLAGNWLLNLPPPLG